MPKKTQTNLDSELVEYAIQAQKRALATYSNFPVGAALRTRDGKVYQAGNIESSSYGLTLCAERVALFKALSEGEREFESIAVAASTDEMCTPCGACRQVLWDYAPDIQVILVNRRGETQTFALADLLPEAFDKRLLK